VPRPVERPEQPAQEVDGRDDGQEDEPEPEEDEQLFVEEVDGERTLKDVAVHAWLVPDLELAERDAREAIGVAPVLAAHQFLDDVQPVHLVVDLEEGVEQEQLPHGVYDVRYLDEYVAGDEVIAVEFAADQAAGLGDEVLDAHHAPGAVFPLRQQVPVHLVDDVPDGLLPYLQVGGLGADPGGVHDGRHVDAWSPVKEAPDEAGQEGEQSLEDEDQRDPLVVADHHLVLLLNERLARDGLIHREIVGVAHPADGIGVVAVAVRELSGAPAGDGPTDELLRAHEEPEGYEDDDRVLAGQAIYVVVVHTELDLADR